MPLRNSCRYGTARAVPTPTDRLPPLPAGFAQVGIGLLGVSFAFGLSVMTMAYAVGGISGGHFNPAVSVGLLAAGRFPARDLLPYVAVQVFAAVFAAGALYLIASGKPGFTLADGFASNGYGEHAPRGYGLGAALPAEALLTFIFVMIILGTRAPASRQASRRWRSDWRCR
jgi:aquaporin Z